MGSAEQLLEVLRALQSNDTTVIKAAEKRFEEAKATAPAQIVEALFAVCAQQQLEIAVREQASVLMRKCFEKPKEADSLWNRLGPQAQEQCKEKLLQLLDSTVSGSEADRKVRKKVADAIQALGNNLIDIADGEMPNNATAWPQMIPALMTMITSAGKDAGIRADALWTMKEMQVSIWQVMVANSSQTLAVLDACLKDSDEGVRANAAILLLEMTDNIEKKQYRAPYTPLCVLFCQVVQALAESSTGDKLLTQLFEVMSNTTETAEFFKDVMASHMLPLLSAIALKHSNDDHRKAALEAMMSFGEARSKQMAKLPNYAQSVLEVCVAFMIELDDDVDGWTENDEEDEEDEEVFTVGKENVDRLGKVMKKAEKDAEFMQAIKTAIGSLFSGGDWKRVVAGVTVLAQIAEYVEDEATALQMIEGIKVQLQAEHPRVRNAAWSAVAQFSEDHSEMMTAEDMANSLLDLFLKGLSDPNQRALGRCMEAFQHFGESVDRELLEPKVQPMMEKIGTLIQSPRISIQKKAITFIAVVAGQVEDHFAPYYAPLMPHLKGIIQKLVHNTEERTLLGKVFECISLLAKAVGPTNFKADAEIILEAMIKATQVPNLPNNDPVKEYMMAAAERICSTMKGDFVPYVPHLLPGILEKFTLAPQEYNSNTFSYNEEDEVSLTLIQDGDKVKVMVMSTSEMEDLNNALSCVHTFAEELGKLYAPYVAQTAEALLKVFDFAMGEGIRDLSFETWGCLCVAAREGGQADVLKQLVQEFLNRLVPKISGNEQRFDLEAMKTDADGITICLKKSGPNMLSPEQMQHIASKALEQLQESLKRREAAKNGKQQAAPDGDDGERGDDEEDDNLQEMNLRIACCEILGAMMEHHADMFVQIVLQEVMKIVTGLQTSGEEDDVRLALFLACDMLEHLQARVTSQWPSFMPKLLEGVQHKSEDIRQPACYGCSLAAKIPEFSEVAVATAGRLMDVIQKTRSLPAKKKHKKDQACADNALSALAEIWIHQTQAVASVESQLVNVWLQGLPCQEDEQEGIKNHKYLMQFVQAEKAQVLGANGANLPQVLKIFIDVYKTDFSAEATSIGIGQFALKLMQLGQLEQLAAQFQGKRKQKLERIVREAQNSVAGAAVGTGGYNA